MDRIENQIDARFLSSLGLSGSPFPTGADTATYFYTDAQKRTVEAALYLARYSDLITLIHGPSGSGKTALCREIARSAGPNVHVVRISGDSSMTPTILCSRILETFSLVEKFPTFEEQLRHIKEQIELLQRKSYHFLLLVDDANQLPNESVVLLESLASMRNESGKTVIKLVLFAPRLDSLYLGGPTLRHRLKLTPIAALTADETLRYLKHRFDQVGGANTCEEIFHARDIARIEREGKGWPGAINALAQQRLLKYVSKTDPASTPAGAPRQERLQIAVASVLGVALITGFVFQSEVSALIANWELTPHTNVPPTEVAATATPALKESQAELAAELPDGVPATNPISDIALDMFALAPTRRAAPVADTVDEVQPAQVAKAPEAPTETPKKKAPSPPKKKSDAAASTLNELDVVDVEVREQRWLLAQSPATYTIQLVGSPDQGDVRRTLKKNRFQELTAKFETTKDDHPWYGLVYGLYPDFSAANKALSGLPADVADKSWIRRVGTLQAEIGSTQPNAAESTEAASAR